MEGSLFFRGQKNPSAKDGEAWINSQDDGFLNRRREGQDGRCYEVSMNPDDLRQVFVVVSHLYHILPYVEDGRQRKGGLVGKCTNSRGFGGRGCLHFHRLPYDPSSRQGEAIFLSKTGHWDIGIYGKERSRRVEALF